MANRWWSRSQPNELKSLPWLAPNVIEFLDKLLKPEWWVLEHGSGGSTLWLAERVKQVVSVEANEEWLQKIQSQGLKNVKLLHADYPKVKFSRKFDLLLIDGEPIETRTAWLKTVEKFVKVGDWVVLDNANRPEYAVERERLTGKAELVKRFDNNEPGTLYLVTEFWKL